MILKRIDVLSAAKMMGALYVVIGLFAGALFSLMAVVGGIMGSALEQDVGGGPALISSLMGIGAIVIFPILYGVLGFVGGAIFAFLYNVIAQRLGGVEFEFVGKALELPR